MIKSVYIAAPFQMRADARLLRTTLNEAGVFVTSRWLNADHPTDEQAAEVDLADIRAASALVLINPLRWAEAGTGGRHTEVGAALVYGMPIYLFGAKSNVFHTLPQCRVVSTSDDLLNALAHDDCTQFAGHVASSSMLQLLIGRVHRANRRWWVDLNTGAMLNRNVGELLMLVVSELSEALEGHRKNLADDKLPQYPMFTVEIADALIRLFDIAGGLDLAVADAFDAKMAFNAQREDHTDAHRKSAHGKKY